MLNEIEGFYHTLINSLPPVLQRYCAQVQVGILDSETR
jgi:hypothetical protein